VDVEGMPDGRIGDSIRTNAAVDYCGERVV
jgi:hypothetical protein